MPSPRTPDRSREHPARLAMQGRFAGLPFEVPQMAGFVWRPYRDRIRGRVSLFPFESNWGSEPDTDPEL